MAFERFLAAVPPQPFTADGTSLGQVTLAIPELFKTGQTVVLRSNSSPAIEVQVKRVLETVLFVGPIDGNVNTRTDISAYTVADVATIEAAEQLKVFIPKDELIPHYTLDELTFESEPTSAKRSILVDLAGRPIDSVLSGGVRRLAVAEIGGGGGGSQVEGNVADSSPDAGNPVKIGSRVQSGALTDSGIANNDRADAISDEFRRIIVTNSPNIAIQHSQVDVGTTAVQLDATPLNGRQRIIIQNTGNKSIYVGSSGVLASDGLRILPNGTLTLELGDDVGIFAVSEMGTLDIRVLELA